MRVCNIEEKVAIIFAGAFTITSFSLLITGLVCFKTGAWISDVGVCTSVYVSGMLMTALVGASIYMYLLKLLIDCVPLTATAPATAPEPTVSVKKNPARIATSVIAV